MKNEVKDEVKNEIFWLRLLEKNYSDKLLQVYQRPETLFPPNDAYRQKVVGEFLMKEIIAIQKLVGDKE